MSVSLLYYYYYYYYYYFCLVCEFNLIFSHFYYYTSISQSPFSLSLLFLSSFHFPGKSFFFFPEKLLKPHCQNNEHQQQEEPNNPTGPFLQCFELILPWLTPIELANISLTFKSLNQLSKSTTLRQSSENLPIPFHNTIDDHLYAHFIYTPSQIFLLLLLLHNPNTNHGVRWVLAAR